MASGKGIVGFSAVGGGPGSAGLKDGFRLDFLGDLQRDGVVSRDEALRCFSGIARKVPQVGHLPQKKAGAVFQLTGGDADSFGHQSGVNVVAVGSVDRWPFVRGLEVDERSGKVGGFDRIP